MKKTTHLNTGLTATAFLLIGTLAVAQTAPTARTVKPRDAASGQSSGITAEQSAQTTQRKSGSIIVLDREAQTGQASGNLQRKDGAIHSADFPRSSNARNSAHATESLSPSNDAKKGENPLYEDHGKSGTNPMYEGKSQANIKPGAGGSAAPYKDPEDMTTRYRPGNNKTTSSAATQGAGASQQQKTVENPVGEMKTSNNSRSSAHATESLQKKHPGNVKYGNFSVSGNK